MCNLNECVMWFELVDCQYEHFLYQPGGLLSCKPPSAVLADLPALCVRCKWFTFFNGLQFIYPFIFKFGLMFSYIQV